MSPDPTDGRRRPQAASRPEVVPVVCPACTKTIRVPVSRLGRPAVCPNPACRQPFTLAAPPVSTGWWLRRAGIAAAVAVAAVVAVAGLVAFGTGGGPPSNDPVPVAGSGAEPTAGPGIISDIDRGPGGAVGAVDPNAGHGPAVAPPPRVATAQPALPPLPFFTPIERVVGADGTRAARREYVAAAEKATAELVAALDTAIGRGVEAVRDLRQQREQLTRFGTVPSAPAVAPAVAQYVQDRGDALDRLIEALQAARSADLGRYQAERTALRNAAAIGTWRRVIGGQGQTQSSEELAVRVNGRTGEWEVYGDLTMRGNLSVLFHGEDVRRDAKGLTFRVKTDFGKSGIPDGAQFTVRLTGDTAACSSSTGYSTTLARTSGVPSSSTHDYFRYGDFTEVTIRTAEPVFDPSDSRHVLRELAELMSFPYSIGLPLAPAQPMPERLLMPNGVIKVNPARSRIAEATATAVARFDRLADATGDRLGPAGWEARRLFVHRLRVATANEFYGQTASSGIRDMQGAVGASFRYVLQRQADRAELERELRDHLPSAGLVVTDAPLSEASRQKPIEVFGAFGGLAEKAEQRGYYSGYIKYGEMQYIDATAALWQQHLMPHVRADRRPPLPGAVRLDGHWTPFTSYGTEHKSCTGSGSQTGSVSTCTTPSSSWCWKHRPATA
ncbi:MAG: hypothetical protein K2X87_27960 [Gemmataceae bacterium]|nr:hypothetical protein [Gemmataceae bacterium]